MSNKPKKSAKEKYRKEITKMFYDGLKLEDVIDIVIEHDGTIGVGLISMSENLAKHVKAKIK